MEKIVEVGKLPEVLPVLPLRDMVVFPLMISPLYVGRDFSLKAVEEALSKDKLILLVPQLDKDKDEITKEDLNKIGTVAIILKAMKLPDGRMKLLVQGLERAQIEEILQERPYFLAKVKHLEDQEFIELDEETHAYVNLIKDEIEKLATYGKGIPPEIIALLKTIEDPSKVADLVAGNIDIDFQKALDLLNTINVKERLKKVIELIEKEIAFLQLQEEIKKKARQSIDKEQKEYFLRHQLRAIRKELGEEDEKLREIEEYKEKIKKAKMPKEVEKEALKELSRLEKMHPESAEASVIRTYLDWLCELPWRKRTKDKLDIVRAKKILDEDHYDLDKVKQRILEFLAVKKLLKQRKKSSKVTKQPTICFVGPPGVGKTSLARSIARALGRKFVRISLGGVRDEAEIRGHRRTYVGAMPGKIIQAIRKAGTKNPVILLDEIDKMSSDFRGDPAAALLEVLDPEQNREFVDHYLGVPFDLSEVLFIATANTPYTIPAPLLDRLEVITIPGYTEEDKINIAKDYIVPKKLKEHGLTNEDVEFTEEGIRYLIRHYTREAGVRDLDRKIAAICRKIAYWLTGGKEEKINVEELKKNGKFIVDEKFVKTVLGYEKYMPEMELEENEVGVATGLAWTSVGGDVLFIETIVTPGTGKLILTGRLGDVMKESAQAALGYIRANAEKYGVKKNFNKIDIHVHVPSGAIPKDGPSAGITLATSMLSALTGKKVKKDVAMTGEITLRGKVLPVGGLKEKILAAMRYGAKTVLLPKKNKSEVMEEVPEDIRKKIRLKFVEDIDEVFNEAIPDLEVKEKKKSCNKRKETTKEVKEH